MLYWTYILILVLLTTVVGIELFREKEWKKQMAYVMILIPFILRILQIK
ncbi:MAG: hypothetical protein GX452_13155 [Ignavibacteriales bacterium]|nr:hypothetical protein [Ignavibacteriaceae bacterium]NLH62341.1 hypothetical protein [Ignavibacteriales bacterium]